LGLLRSDSGEFAVLRRIRGRLLRCPTGGDPVKVVALGPAAWIGWVELMSDRVNEVAITNTALGGDYLLPRPAAAAASTELSIFCGLKSAGACLGGKSRKVSAWSLRR
jgi:hypothetical protein